MSEDYTRARCLDPTFTAADPFDRALVAQAQVEGATIVSHDRALKAYGVPIIWT